MYKFIDVNEQPNKMLSAEAVSINGEYLDEVILGFKTLYVQGRELLAPDIKSKEVGARHGEIMLNSRYPKRKLVVGYQLISDGNLAFREAYIKLSDKLGTPNSRIIFRDEMDKYWVGTVSEVGEVPPGRNSITSEFSIDCLTPFKFAVNEKEVNIDPDGTLNIDYKGTVPAHPRIFADFNGDSGYFAVTDEHSNTVIAGNPKEQDTGNKSEMLFDEPFRKPLNTSIWRINQGFEFPWYQQAGGAYIRQANEDAAAASSYGSYGSKPYHGPSLIRSIPADSSGSKKCTNFTLTYRVRCAIGRGEINQLGGNMMLLLDDSNNVIAGIAYYKNSVGEMAECCLYVNGKEVSKTLIGVTRAYRQLGFGEATGGDYIGTSMIKKVGDTIHFDTAGTNFTFSDPAVKDKYPTKCQLAFYEAYRNPNISDNEIYWVKFVKDNVEYDIANTFMNGDKLEMDCATGEIRKNHLPVPGIGALGNDWEDLVLVPGHNKLSTFWSTWQPQAPDVKVKYREVFL